jgi:hypothetical protein
VKSESCHRLAPNHVNRRRADSVSRRMLTAARIAKAKSSAADSPPTSSSRRPATSLASEAAPRSTRGALRSAANDVFWKDVRACAMSSANASMFQARTLPGASGTTHA